MPGLTIATDGRPAPAPARGTSTNPRRRTSSPSRPPVSPITPTLGPTQLPGDPSARPTTTTTTTTAGPSSETNSQTIPDFALGRPTFTHTQPDQVGIPPAPAPAQPVNLDENPDALALRSAISILQLQRARATADIQALSRAKAAALADPAAFVADLAAGQVRTEGDPLFSRSGVVAAGDDDGDEEDEDEDEESEEEEESGDEEETRESPRTTGTGVGPDGAGGDGTGESSKTRPRSSRRKPNKRKGKQRDGQPEHEPPWRKLPKPQTVVRCPPINWAQYGVVGESLDKLHAEQLAAPTPGAPLVLGPGGTYEFKAGSGGDQAVGEQPQRLVGIAAPYAPGRDKLEKKGKAGKR
ncbi:hypothetical protein VTK56DRAFT_291 [Thermocarpiscus australiensis]